MGIKEQIHKTTESTKTFLKRHVPDMVDQVMYVYTLFACDIFLSLIIPFFHYSHYFHHFYYFMLLFTVTKLLNLHNRLVIEKKAETEAIQVALDVMLRHTQRLESRYQELSDLSSGDHLMMLRDQVINSNKIIVLIKIAYCI